MPKIYAQQISADGALGVYTGIEKSSTIPVGDISQNFPNPLNNHTVIKYVLSQKQSVKVTVFDFSGKEIETLVNETKPAGSYQVDFDASQIPAGIYFYRIKAGDYATTRKMVVRR